MGAYRAYPSLDAAQHRIHLVESEVEVAAVAQAYEDARQVVLGVLVVEARRIGGQAGRLQVGDPRVREARNRRAVDDAVVRRPGDLDIRNVLYDTHTYI